MRLCPATPAIRTSCSIALIASAMILATPASGGTRQLGTSGWEAHWDSSLDGRVDVDFVEFIGDAVFVQKSAEFIDGSVNGEFSAISITFRQTGPSSVAHIVMEDEIITNSTGEDWSGFCMKLVNGGAVFDPGMTAGSGGTGPIGFTISPFTTASFVEENTKLRINGGVVEDTDNWLPGSGAEDGQLWINVQSGLNGDLNSFSLRERPVAMVIPGPASLGILALCGAFMRHRRRTR